MRQLKRKQIYISEHQQSQLKRLSKQRGVSETEIIQKAIEREILLVESRTVSGNYSALEEFIRFGLSRRPSEESTSRGWLRDELI